MIAYSSKNASRSIYGVVLIRLIKTCSLILPFLITVMAVAQSSEDFRITKFTIDGGGELSSGDGFSLVGTIGQPDANRQVSTGSGFALAGGFWANAVVLDMIFKDSFESN